MTSGRQCATARATAWEPSIWLRIAGLPDRRGDSSVRLFGGIDVRPGDVFREPAPDCLGDRAESDGSCERRECAEQGRVGKWATQATASNLGRGNRADALRPKRRDDLLQSELAQR